MIRIFAAVLIIFTSLYAGQLFADEKQDREVANIRQVLSTLVVRLSPDKIEKSELAGFYVATYGTKIIYISSDGRFLLNGELIDTGLKINLTERKRSLSRLDVIKDVSEDDMIIFSPKVTKYTVTVFTDIDCAFCRKLHRDVNQHLENGVRIRYMFYPRAGINSDSYRKAISVWCAKDRNQALTDAKAGKEIEMKTCKHPIAKHMNIADKLGLTGTPLLILDDGTKISGYVTPTQLKEHLGTI